MQRAAAAAPMAMPPRSILACCHREGALCFDDAGGGVGAEAVDGVAQCGDGAVAAGEEAQELPLARGGALGVCFAVGAEGVAPVVEDDSEALDGAYGVGCALGAAEEVDDSAECLLDGLGVGVDALDPDGLDRDEAGVAAGAKG